MELADRIVEVVTQADFGQPSARKAGRNPKWPYVPIIKISPAADGCHLVQTHQLKGLAFATREEAVASAERAIARSRVDLADKLAQPRFRALRRQYGLEEELS